MPQATLPEITAATPDDVPLILALIRELADFEKLSHQVIATEAILQESLFAPGAVASALIARVAGEPAGFALYFFNFSTFVGRRGLYLEDLFVRPAFRGRAIGKQLLRHLARVALTHDCGRFDWAVLDWNSSARRFYESLGAEAHPDWITYRLSGAALQRLAAADD